jgi:ferric-dicitrate binding protein FerR (iron transport regulator)
MENKSYKSLEDFILTESFRDYVLENDIEAVEFWNRWILEHPEQKDEFERAKLILSALLKSHKQHVPFDKREALTDLLEKINYAEYGPKRPKEKIINSGWFRAAALVVVLLSVSLLWKFLSNTKESIDNGEYQIIVPIGEKSQVILPDGTHVWINSGSRIVYPAKYDVNNRNVYLEGEAYFDVTKQHGKPFMVKTKDINIKVLGTAFNVKGYASDKTVETTVVRGLVKVESAADQQNSIFVNPNEKAVYTKLDKQMTTTMNSVVNTSSKPIKRSVEPIAVIKINPEPVTCWKDQLLVFTDETFEDMVIKMERWYNIKITIMDPNLKKERFNGKFVHNETVYQVLEAIKLTTPIKYTNKDNEIYITQK